MRHILFFLFASFIALPAFADAIAKIEPRSGSKVSGVAVFQGASEGAQLSLKLNGLTPGQHGFHIHEKGDCSAPDASSAGPHFNPTAAKHGGPHSAEKHKGDLGNVTADAEGSVETKLLLPGIQIEQLLGRALVVHEKSDDLVSDPSGNSGPRVGCGVITANESGPR